MKEQDSIFQLDITTLRVAGVGLWTYDSVERELWYSGFADNVHLASEPLCVDVDSYLAIVANEDKRSVAEYILSLNTATPISNLRYKIHGDGEDFYLDNRVVSSTPKEDGFIVHGYAQNITRQVLLECELAEACRKAQHSEQLKSAFIANISHEFRTPITAITGFSSLLIQSNDNAEKEEYMTIVEENSKRLLRLIDSLIHLSELQVGSYIFSPRSFNLSRLIDRLIVDYKPQCGKGVEMVNKTQHEMSFLEVVSDENAVSVVFSNLLKNALKYTSTGEISLGYRVDEKGRTTCFVSDTGVGIPQDQQKQVFETFYQNDNFDEGVGLGLSVCKLIMKGIGGRIWVESEPQAGTTIYFTLSL
ncbi:MAG: HAMP domain-containing sensor histidine kinase [Bacteroidales bacterium]